MPIRRKSTTGDPLKIINSVCLCPRVRSVHRALACAKVSLLFIPLYLMLEFWFDPKIAVFKKLTLFVLIGLVTAGLYWMQPLTLDAILMFMGTGIVFLICRYCKTHFASSNPAGLLYRLFTWIPLALLLALIFMHLKNWRHSHSWCTGYRLYGVIHLSIFAPILAQPTSTGLTPKCSNFGTQNAAPVKSDSSVVLGYVSVFISVLALRNLHHYG